MNNDHVRALIIDDEIDICFLLSGILKKKNYDTCYVNSISDAKESLARNLPSIILLDNHLPDGLGMNFIREVKDKYPTVKIIMLTAHDTSSDQHKAFEQGVDSFIGKPFTVASISNTIDYLIN